jgi:protease I
VSDKILILTGDAGEALEVMYPLQRLREAGYTVHVAAPTKKTLRLVVHDFEPGFDTYTEKPGYRLEADLAFADVNPDDYRGLVIPGGRAPEYIRNDPDFRRIVRAFFDRPRPVAQICHAPLGLIAAGVVKGRTLSGYPALAPDIEQAGANYVDGAAVVDGLVVSARAWPDHPEWMRTYLQLLTQTVPEEATTP